MRPLRLPTFGPDTARVRLDLHLRSHDLIADYCMRQFSLGGGPDMLEGATIFLRENPNLFNVGEDLPRCVQKVISVHNG